MLPRLLGLLQHPPLVRRRPVARRVRLLREVLGKAVQRLALADLDDGIVLQPALSQLQPPLHGLRAGEAGPSQTSSPTAASTTATTPSRDARRSTLTLSVSITTTGSSCFTASPTPQSISPTWPTTPSARGRPHLGMSSVHVEAHRRRRAPIRLRRKTARSMGWRQAQGRAAVPVGHTDRVEGFNSRRSLRYAV